MGSKGHVFINGTRNVILSQTCYQPFDVKQIQLTINRGRNKKVHGQKVLWRMACHCGKKFRY